MAGDHLVDVEHVLDRRHREREALLGRARQFAAGLPSGLDVRAVVVFGSVARGDFGRWSDVDVLVVAERMPQRVLDRLEALGDAPGGVAPVAWTPGEFRDQVARQNPIAREAIENGLWLVGSPEHLAGV